MAKKTVVEGHRVEISEYEGVPVVPIHVLGIREAIGWIDTGGNRTHMREVHLLATICGLPHGAIFRFRKRSDLEAFMGALKTTADKIWPLS